MKRALLAVGMFAGICCVVAACYCVGSGFDSEGTEGLMGTVLLILTVFAVAMFSFCWDMAGWFLRQRNGR